MSTPTTAPSPATALIAEDEPLLAAALAADLARLWPELHIVARVADGLSAVQQALLHQPTLCFLDIRMPGASGLEAALALAEDWPDGTPGCLPFPLLVFVTAYDQYALQAFDAQAVDYLVKPVDQNRLAACVARLQKRLADRAMGGSAASKAPSDLKLASELTPVEVSMSMAVPPGNFASTLDPALQQTLAQLRALLDAAGQAVAANTNGGATHTLIANANALPKLEVIQAGVGHTVHLVPVAEVLYFEAADKYLRVVTVDREHLIRLSLRELMPQLDGQVFWQVHRSLVVRAAAISTAQRDESGKVFLSLRGRAERLTASRLYAHLFKGM